MSIQRPIHMGSELEERPNVVCELLVEADFPGDLSADELNSLREQLWDKMYGAVTRAVRGVDAHVDVMRGRGAETPVFPMTAGESTFQSNLDIVELIQRLCHEGTDLYQTAYDATGRAYELDVEITYHRRPDLDRTILG